MSPSTTALVVGKFAPFHIGHQRLIELAIELADDVVVLCWSNPDFEFADSAERASWIREIYPTVKVLTPSGVPPNSSPDDVQQAFTHGLISEFGLLIDFVVSGEDYGDALARRLSAKHIRIDRSIPGVAVAISGTMIRSNLAVSSAFLHPVVMSSLNGKCDRNGTLI